VCAVDRVHDDGVNALANSVEFIWGTTTVAVGDTAVLHCSFDAIFQQLRTGSVSYGNSLQFTCNRKTFWFKYKNVQNQLSGDVKPPLTLVA